MRVFALVAAALLGVDGVRKQRQGSHHATKFIEGIPIVNYDRAYGGASLSEVEKTQKEQEWIVVVKKGTKRFLMNKLCKTLECTFQGDSEKGLPIVTVKSTENGLKQKLYLRLAKKLIKFIEPDSEVQAIPEMPAVQNAPSWGLDRVGADKRANEGAGVHVYVLDTGVLATHSDFGGRVIPTLDMSSGSAVYCTAGQTTCTNDAQGHGTHCAGTVAGKTYGVAPAASVHAVKVLSDTGSGSWSWSFTALDFLATGAERPTISSMSLGGQGVMASMGEAVTAAVDAGVVVVVASGNSNSDACGFSPAFTPAAITVGSTTSRDARSSFSNYGPCQDIYAPGSDITSAAHNSDTGSRTLSGTSMACPHVSGAAALLLEKNPTLSADEVLELMLSTATDGALSDMKAGDTNRLLYVGNDLDATHPPIVPTPAPELPCGAFCVFCTDRCKGCAHCQ